ncbi:unnamed protein product, partial [Urochloa humidicola]
LSHQASVRARASDHTQSLLHPEINGGSASERAGAGGVAGRAAAGVRAVGARAACRQHVQGRRHAGAPVIDMSEPGCGARIAEAAREWGLFQVVNHGVPSSVVAELQRVGRAFFDLPREEKERYAMDPASGKIEGYGTKLQRDLEGKKTWNDFFFHVVAPPEQVNHGVWPRSPAGYKEDNEAYCSHMQRLTRELYGHLSLGLGLEEGAMSEAFGGDRLVFLQKINFYPPCPQPELTLGVAPHTDMSTLTVLVPNEVQGLQIFKDGHWYDAKFSATGSTRRCCTERR